MVDEASIPFLGYLPQEMEGSDIFSFYHPGDLPYLKEVYENLMADQGKRVKSRPYRFKVKNGCYITMETNWSCFINPWSKKLEFVLGQHTVLKGPTNKDIFAETGDQSELAVNQTTATTETAKNNNNTLACIDEVPVNQVKSIQENIRMLLQETITRRPAAAISTSNGGDLKTTQSSRRQKLASFMGTLLEAMTQAGQTSTKEPSINRYV